MVHQDLAPDQAGQAEEKLVKLVHWTIPFSATSTLALPKKNANYLSIPQLHSVLYFKITTDEKYL